MALIYNWIHKCLLCMQDAPGAIPVFGSHAQKKSVRRMISEFLNINVRQSDDYPRQICEKCYDTLLKINDLKSSAHESLRNLKLLQDFHQQKGQEEGKAEYIRLWLGSQRADPEASELDQQDSPNPQQPSDFTCSSISANEATSSVLFNVSAVVSENSDADRGVGNKPNKRSEISLLHFSSPSSRSCSPQPGSLPPESSRKQFQSTVRSQSKGRLKTTVQQNEVNSLPEKGANQSGSPRPGSLPPETTGKGSTSRKRSKNLPNSCESTPQKTKNNVSELKAQEPSLKTSAKETSVVHRSRSCSPRRENRKRHSSSEQPRPRGRPRSRSVPPAKRPKIAEPQHKKWHMVSLIGKPKLSQPYLDDDVQFGRISVPCDLKQFQRRIPFVKLVPVENTTPSSAPKCTVPKPPLSQVQMLQDFTLVKHVRDKSGNIKQLCLVCDEMYRTNKNMEHHLLKHRHKRNEPTFCIQVVPDPSKERASPSLFTCSLCDIHFTTNFALQRHMSFHAEKKWRYKCKECEETFRTNLILECHMRQHNARSQAEVQPIKFTCSCCLHDFGDEETLHRHMLQHRKCTLCNQTFTGKNQLAAHVSSCHKVCTLCDEAVADEEELESHIESSHEKCNVCGELFLGQEELGVHLSKHPYQCALCFSAFNNKAQRNEHFKRSHHDMLEILKETITKQAGAT